MDCSELIEQLSEYLDENAKQTLCREIDEHLTRCSECRLYVDTVKKTIVIVQGDRQVATPVWINDRLQQALARAYTKPPEGSND